MTKKLNKATDFKIYLTKQLKDKELKKHYDEHGKQLEVAYQILQLRKKGNLSQLELANKIGTNQSNIARMESGRQNFTIDILAKIANVFNKNLIVTIR